MILDSRILITAFLFVLSFLFGIWLSKLGKPYNVVVFTFHKIIGAAAIIFTAITVYNLQKFLALSPTELIIIIAAVVLLITTLVSGALLSIEKISINFMLPLHKISSVAVTVFTAVTIYLLLINK